MLGTGMVGRAVAARLAEVGHDVAVGTRGVDATMARREPDAMGNPPFATWLAGHPHLLLETFANAARYGELVVNATEGTATPAALRAAGADNLAGKVLVDVSNALDFSRGFPPSLLVNDEDSLAEQVQREFPQARVVKTLNTMNAHVMVHPESLGGGDHTVFVAGNDAAAKATVVSLLQQFGWHDVIDLGDLSAARGTEMILPLWLRLMGALGGPAFNFKVVRAIG